MRRSELIEAIRHAPVVIRRNARKVVAYTVLAWVALHLLFWALTGQP